MQSMFIQLNPDHFSAFDYAPTLIGLQKFSQSGSVEIIFSLTPSRMTSVSELQKGQEMVVVVSRKLLPFRSIFHPSFKDQWIKPLNNYGIIFSISSVLNLRNESKFF